MSAARAALHQLVDRLPEDALANATEFLAVSLRSVSATALKEAGPSEAKSPTQGRDPDVVQPGDWDRARAFLAALPELPPQVGELPPLPDNDL